MTTTLEWLNHEEIPFELLKRELRVGVFLLCHVSALMENGLQLSVKAPLNQVVVTISSQLNYVHEKSQVVRCLF